MTDHVYGGEPFVAARVCEYAPAMAPHVSVGGVVIATVGALIVRANV